MLHRTLIAFAAAVALGCVPVATDALAAGHPRGHASAGHPTGGHATAGHAMAGPARGGHVARSGGGYYRTGPIYNGPIYNGPIYGNCAGYDPGYGYAGQILGV